MFPEDIEALFDQIPVGTPVRIVNQPIKLGRHGADFYVEAHPPLMEALPDEGWNMTELTRAYVALVEEGGGNGFSWELAERAAMISHGIPEFVSSAPSTAANERF
jgi:L,D-transpeptidase ErfK/SrfK